MTRFRKVLLTAAMATGLLMPSSGALARRHKCSGSIRSGNAPFLMKKYRSYTRVNSPLLEDGKYLRLQMPSRYMKEVEKASAGLPAANRAGFVGTVIQKNMGAALAKLTKRRSIRFYCVEPKPAAPQPVARPQPRSPAPAPRPAPRKDDGRRRIIVFDDPVETTRPRPASQLPIRPYQSGGSGTQSTPYVITVPVPHTKDGAAMYTGSFNIGMGSLNMGTLYFSYKFIGKSTTPRKTTVRLLANAMTDVAKRIIRARMVAKNVRTTIPNFVLRVQSIVRQARSNLFVKKYVQ